MDVDKDVQQGISSPPGFVSEEIEIENQKFWKGLIAYFPLI
jgi:hypothetical protein